MHELRRGWEVDSGYLGGVASPNMRTHRVESDYPGVCLYMRQGVRIVCGEDRKDE